MNSVTLTDLSKSFQDQTVFDRLSLTLAPGFTCLYGPSGCGKSTLLSILAGNEEADKGTISGIVAPVTVLFQEPRLFPNVSAIKNVTAPLRDKDALTKARHLLHSLSLTEEDLDKKTEELSGGMQQRVALARAILFAKENNGNLVLLDEPFRGLDAERRAKVASLLLDSLSDKIVLVVTHDAEDTALLRATPIQFHTLTAEE